MAAAWGAEFINPVQERRQTVGSAEALVAPQECAVVGRITRPPKPKQDCIAGATGYEKRPPFWAFTIYSFGRKEQAADMELYLGRRRETEGRAFYLWV